MSTENNLQEQINQLEKKLLKHEQNFKSSFRNTTIFYAVIIVVVLAYTTILNKKIKEAATPASVAVMINEKVAAAIPELRSQIKTQLEPSAKEAATKTVAMLHKITPYAKELVKSRINIYTDKIADKLEKEHLPAFEVALDRALTDVEKNKDIVKDHNLGKELSAHLIKELDKELAKIIDRPFMDALDKLTSDIEKLHSTPANELNKKQLAERKFIATWLYLINTDQNDDKGMLSNILEVITSATGKAEDSM
jgi:hypothetical protein